MEFGQPVPEKIFEQGGRTDDDGRTDVRRLDVYTISSPEPISSPCEPNGSGEIITQPVLAPRGRKNPPNRDPMITANRYM